MQGVAARQVASFKEALHALNPSIPLILQPGNHDIGQRPTPADVQRYRELFGDDYFSFWVGGVMCAAAPLLTPQPCSRLCALT